jgi:hypothetical protein
VVLVVLGQQAVVVMSLSFFFITSADLFAPKILPPRLAALAPGLEKEDTYFQNLLLSKTWSFQKLDTVSKF